MKKGKNYRSISHGQRSHLKEGSRGREGGGGAGRRGKKKLSRSGSSVYTRRIYTVGVVAEVAGNGDRFQKRCLTSKCDRWIGRSLTVSREDSSSFGERRRAHYARRIRNSVHEVDNRGPPRDTGSRHTVNTEGPIRDATRV